MKKELIRIANLEKENKKLKEELERNEDSFKSVSYYMIQSFKKASEKMKEEITLLKDGKAEIEAELILKKLKEVIIESNKTKR